MAWQPSAAPDRDPRHSGPVPRTSCQVDAGVFQGLRVGDDDLGLFLQKPPGDEDGGLSRVSPVLALKAKPHRQIFLPARVLNMASSMFRMKRSCWYSLI